VLLELPKEVNEHSVLTVKVSSQFINSNLDIPHRPNSTFGKQNLIGCRILVGIHKIYAKLTLLGVAPPPPRHTSHSRNDVVKKCQFSVFTGEHRAAKHQIDLFLDVMLRLILWMRLALFPSYLYSTSQTSLCSLTNPKGIYLNKACSGFEPETPTLSVVWTWMTDNKWKLQVSGSRIQCPGKDLFANVADFQHPLVFRTIYPIRVNATFVILNINCVNCYIHG
jgi:hypothetical protein